MFNNIAQPEFIVEQLHDDLYVVTMVSKIDDETMVIATADTEYFANYIAELWRNWFSSFENTLNEINKLDKANKNVN